MSCNLFQLLKDHFIYRIPPYENTQLEIKIHNTPYYMIDQKSTKCMIWCHGNSDTIDSIYDRVNTISNRAKTTIIISEYPGYGEADGTPSEPALVESLINTIAVAKKLQFAEADITLVGRSLGTGVVCVAAAELSWKGKILLISPFKSILKIAVDYHDRYLCDNYENDLHCRKIECPVYVFHGTRDVTVPKSHSEQICKGRDNFMLTLLDATHHDIVNLVDFTCL